MTLLCYVNPLYYSKILFELNPKGVFYGKTYPGR